MECKPRVEESEKEDDEKTEEEDEEDEDEEIETEEGAGDGERGIIAMPWKQNFEDDLRRKE